jgi:hypothetical protein
MSQDNTPHHLPAPCIIDFGTIVNKDDMKRLLNDLYRVRYTHSIDGILQSEGEGTIVEVFIDPHQSTLIANGNLYINIHSFDFLQLNQSPLEETYFDLIQDNRQLRIIPLSKFSQEEEENNSFNASTIEEMVTKVLSAKWDVHFDDEDYSF